MVFWRKLQQDSVRIEEVMIKLGEKLEEGIVECDNSLKTGENTLDMYKQYFMEKSASKKVFWINELKN